MKILYNENVISIGEHHSVGVTCQICQGLEREKEGGWGVGKYLIVPTNSKLSLIYRSMASRKESHTRDL